MNVARFKTRKNGRVAVGLARGAMISAAVFGTTFAEIAHGEPEPKFVRFPDEMVSMNTVSVGDQTDAKVVGAGATLANLNCDPWPDYCYLTADGTSIVVQFGADDTAAQLPKAQELKLPDGSFARFVVIADFAPRDQGENPPPDCMEIAVVTDGAGDANRQLLWVRRKADGSTMEIVSGWTTSLPGTPPGAPRAVSVANLDPPAEAALKLPEIIIASKNTGQPKLSVFGSAGGAPLSRVTTINLLTANDDPTSIDPADLDDDKDLDLDIKTRSTLPVGGLVQRQSLINAGYLAMTKEFDLKRSKQIKLPAP